MKFGELPKSKMVFRAKLLLLTHVESDERRRRRPREKQTRIYSGDNLGSRACLQF
jgi:hypothetical protein